MCIIHRIPYCLWKNTIWNLLKSALRVRLSVRYHHSKSVPRHQCARISSRAVASKYMYTHTYVCPRVHELLSAFCAVHRNNTHLSTPTPISNPQTILIPIQVSMTEKIVCTLRVCWRWGGLHTCICILCFVLMRVTIFGREETGLAIVLGLLLSHLWLFMDVLTDNTLKDNQSIQVKILTLAWHTCSVNSLEKDSFFPPERGYRETNLLY